MQMQAKTFDFNQGKSLQEAYGAVTGANRVTDLANIITEYVFDSANGLEHDKTFMGEDNICIDYDIIKAYYLFNYKNKTDADLVLPQWIGDFRLYFDDESGANGAYLKSSCQYDEKLKTTTFIIVTKYEHTKEKMSSNLAHEFRHAYDDYLEHKNGFKQETEEQSKLYDLGQDAAKELEKETNFFTDIKLVDFMKCDKDANSAILHKANIKDLVLYNLYFNSATEYKAHMDQFVHDSENTINNLSDEEKRDLSISIQRNKGIMTQKVNPFGDIYFKRHYILRYFWKELFNVYTMDELTDYVSKNAYTIKRILITINKKWKNRYVTSDNTETIMKELQTYYLSICNRVIDNYYKLTYFVVDKFMDNIRKGIDQKIEIASQSNKWITDPELISDMQKIDDCDEFDFNEK